VSDSAPPNTTTSADTTAPGAASGQTGTPATQDVPLRLGRKPSLTESAVGTAPPGRPTDEVVTVTIDGRQVKARKGQLIIDVADGAGTYIPRFCYHPRMKPVGMCRMCLVEVKGPRGASLMPACYNPVAEGMDISTTSDMTKKAQDGVLEFLLVNHPLDCPVCDKGGECPLQDQTLAYGPGESRFVEEKRHWEKPTPVSELVNLDRERCIQCGRCVRFADEVAGDPLIDFYERGDKTEVAVFADSNPFSSYFSGNIVQICPVGALTATPYRFRARPWDLEQVESSCTSCSVGCRSAVQASSDELVRSLGVDNDPVNWSWLCDKGRFDFQAGNSDQRLTVPLVRQGDELVEVSWAEALTRAAEGLVANRPFGSAVAVIGGSRLPNEDAYAWAKLARVGLHTDHVDAQLGDGIRADVVAGLPRATIDEAAAAPLVITIAGDIKDELPILYLRLRHAAREEGLQICEITPASTGLTREAAATLRYRPGSLADLVAAITAPSGPTEPVGGVAADDVAEVRAHIDRARSKVAPGTAPVVVILGRPSLAESDDAVIAAAEALSAIEGVKFLSALRRSNVHGAIDLGLAPGLLPGRVSLDEGRD
jgi:NADH-quinone oxidoreductase subunit G